MNDEATISLPTSRFRHWVDRAEKAERERDEAMEFLGEIAHELEMHVASGNCSLFVGDRLRLRAHIIRDFLARVEYQEQP